MPGHGKGRRFDRNLDDALACSHMTDIDHQVLRAGSQHATVVTEAQRADRPFQSDDDQLKIKTNTYHLTKESLQLFTQQKEKKRRSLKSPRECAYAAYFICIPERDKGVCRPSSKIPSGWVKFDTDAVGRMSLNGVHCR